MGIIIKYLIRNIKEKKTRTVLIVMSIAISTALFFASMAMMDTAMNIYIKQVRSAFGEAEIVVQPNDRSPADYFTVHFPKTIQKEIAYTIGVVEANAVYRHKKDETYTLALKGVDWEDLDRIGTVDMKEESGLLPFTGKKLIVGSYTAKKYSLKPGQILELDIGQKRYRFFIAGIANPSGIFSRDSGLLVVPKDTLSAICSGFGNVSKLFIKLKEPRDKEKIMKELSQYIRRYDVLNSISDQQFREETEPLNITLNMALIVVLLLSVFIINTSFKVITFERLPIIGTFRSVGANRKTTDALLLGESFIYGVVGGTLGCGLGLIILFVLALATASSPESGGSTSPALTFSLLQLVVSFMAAVILSLVSSLLPILRVARTPVKDIVLNMVQKRETALKGWKLTAGVSLILLIIILPTVGQGTTAMIMDIVCIGMAIPVTILLIPFVIAWAVKIFERLYFGVFGPAGVLALKNLRGNKNAQNSITLLAIGISTLLMVSIFGKSILTGVVDFTDQSLKYDISFFLSKMDRTIEPVARSVKGVDGVYGMFVKSDVEVVGSEERISYLEGVDPTRFDDFKSIAGVSGDRTLLKKLNSKRSIILNQLLLIRYGLQVGDVIMLRLNHKERGYTIIGAMDTMEGGGGYAIISDRFFKADTGMTFYSELAVKARKPESVLQALRNKFSRSMPSGNTIKEHQNMIMGEMNGVLSILNCFSLLTALIGLVGLINNLTINFMERKRSLAILRSVGASRKQTILMAIIESGTGGIIGSIVGILGGLLMIYVMPFMTKTIIATIPMKYSFNLLVGTGFAGLSVTLFASVVPALRSSRLNIIESIKYE